MTTTTPRKRVLVTGAARGIGKETAKLFENAKCEVLALDKDFEECDLPPSITRVQFDLRNVEAIPKLIEDLGHIDSCVNNAGQLYCPSPEGLSNGSLGFTLDQSTEIMTVNLFAPVALIESLAPQMMARGQNGEIGGRIVNVGSVAAFTGHPDLWYGASKAALLNMTKTFATLMGKSGVLVNAVAPGPTLTKMYESLPQSRKDMVTRTVYTGRPAKPQEVAEAILWLGTTSPEYVNGMTLDANNGSYPR